MQLFIFLELFPAVCSISCSAVAPQEDAASIRAKKGSVKKENLLGISDIYFLFLKNINNLCAILFFLCSMASHPFLHKLKW
jgi:hypothetical protein